MTNLGTWPADIASIEPVWVSQLLNIRYPGVQVADLALSDIRYGSCTTAKLSLTYTHDVGLPDTMWMKGPWDSRARDGLVPEVIFYRDVAPVLSMNRPQSYAAHSDSLNPERSVLLLEDLGRRGARFGSASDSISPDDAADLLDALAELHAFSTRPSSAVPTGLQSRFTVSNPGSYEGIFGSFKEAWWEKQMSRPRAASVPGELRDRNRVRRALHRMMELDASEDSQIVLVHGDAHLGNVFFERTGRPGIVDFPIGKAHWAIDVTYGIISWLRVSDRQASARDLLAHYTERVAAHGGPVIDRESALLDWRRHMVHGLLWMMCSPRQQPEDLITVQTERFAAAAHDEDMFGSLGV